jgi:hypothetical protein
MIEGAIFTESVAWQKDPANGWKLMDGTTKKRACQAFMVGMASRVSQRLNELAAQRETVAKTASGTALVVIRNQLVDAAFAKLHLNFKGSSGISIRDSSAYGAGRAAGDRVNFNRPVGHAAFKRIGA